MGSGGALFISSPIPVDTDVLFIIIFSFSPTLTLSLFFSLRKYDYIFLLKYFPLHFHIFSGSSLDSQI